MKEFDDHVIPYEEAVRRHRAIEEAQRREKGAAHEVKMSEAMSHLLEDGETPDEEGPSPEHLRQIVERDFAGRSGPSEQEERPRPHLVQDPEEEPMGQVCSFETRRCEDPAERPEEPPRH
jgi:hypothetical protein